MTPEAKVKKQIRAVLDKYKAYYAMPIGSAYGRSGVPDFLVCYHGRFIAIEAKAGKGTTTLLQQENLRRIERNKGVTVVVNENTVRAVEEILITIDHIENVRTAK